VLAGILGAAPAPALVANVRRRTGGNPFFVQQVSRLLAQSGSPDRLQTASETGIPFGVREAVERRLARLRPPCAEVVTAAAVVGPEFGPALLSRVTGRPAGAVRDLLDEAVRAQVLAAPAGPLQPYRFAHDLFRESIDERLGTEARARLHRQIGEALEAERDAVGGVSLAQLANHFARAGAGAEDAAVRYATLAAAEATQRLAHAEAAQHLARALEALDGSAQPQGPRRVELLLELAAAHRRAGDLAASRRACRRAAELASRAGDAQALARSALSLHAIGSRSWPSLAGELLLALEEASVALGEQDTPLRARVLASLARELAWNGTDVARAARLADAAVTTALRTGDRATLAACLLAQHNAIWEPGNAADRLALAVQITELAEEIGDLELAAEARLLRVADLLELADPAFQGELAEFLRLAAALRQPRWRYAALSRLAMQALLAGRFDEVEPLVQLAAALAREIDEPDAADVELSQLWELRGDQGRRAELLERLRDLFPDDSPPRRYFEAMALLEQGDRKGAEHAAGPLLDLMDITALPADRSWIPAATFAAELAAALGMRPACEVLYQALAPYAAGAVMVGAAITFRGAVAYYLGLLATVLDRPEEAGGHFQHASDVHQRLGAKAWRLPTRQQLAGLLPGPPMAQEPPGGEAPTTGGTFQRDGALWTLAYAGREVRMRDAKGLRDLATLLRAPGRPVHAADLLAGRADEEAAAADLRLGADEVLDDRARREIRERLLELEDETEEANRWHDAERAARATLERDALLREVAAAAGLGGRARRLGDQSERAARRSPPGSVTSSTGSTASTRPWGRTCVPRSSPARSAPTPHRRRRRGSCSPISRDLAISRASPFGRQARARGGTPLYDVIIVGARVAGSSTAMLLARKGLSVLLVDRASFPSDTLSTHQVQLPGGPAPRCARASSSRRSWSRTGASPASAAGRRAARRPPRRRACSSARTASTPWSPGPSGRPSSTRSRRCRWPATPTGKASRSRAARSTRGSAARSAPGRPTTGCC
jgi:hypothetical protein